MSFVFKVHCSIPAEVMWLHLTQLLSQVLRVAKIILGLLLISAWCVQ